MIKFVSDLIVCFKSLKIIIFLVYFWLKKNNKIRYLEVVDIE